MIVSPAISQVQFESMLKGPASSRPITEQSQEQQYKALHAYPVQVININLLYPNPFPADQTVAIINQTAQLIHVADRIPVTPNEVRPV